MKSIYILLIVSVVGAGAYFWYSPVLPLCKLPVKYSLGDIDPRFDLSEQQAMAALAEAEGIWEDSIGRDDIFHYQEDAPVRVNFVYDERQKQADVISDSLDDLSTRGEANEVLIELHSRLVAQYNAHEARYEAMKLSYEEKLTSYNAEVEKYNREGGAPEEEYQKLEAQKRELDREREEINQLAAQMNDLVDQINMIGEKGNELIEEYNQRVNTFNDSYAEGHEYTQGDYQAREINIYTFKNNRELMLVLAHELGHSLAIDHVENPVSIMYYLMGEQSEPPVLTAEDIEAFNQTCDGSLVDRLLGAFTRLYNWS